MKTAIIIPARYGSTRFPGKPLVKIGDKTMLERVVEIARAAARGLNGVRVMVATEDSRIDHYCRTLGVECVMTPDTCASGSDRVLAAAKGAGGHFDFLIGLQGDAPFTPVDAVHGLIRAVQANPLLEVITPVVRLRWSELDALREAKKTTPFSGTTTIIDNRGFAVWFSKNILPAMRKESDMRAADAYSPVYQHLGLYGYRADVLQRFVDLPQSPYESLEGLEQLRFIENGISIRALEIAVGAGLAQAGIDSPEDVARAERLIRDMGL